MTQPPIASPLPGPRPETVTDDTETVGTLWAAGYLSLLATQFLGAANDNIMKQCLTFMVATGIWSGPLGEGGLGVGGQVVPALLLTLPFIFLSGYAGQIADRFSKRKVMLCVKLAEVPIALLALVGFWSHSLYLTLFALLLLSVQSSFFGPAKFGVIPELVPESKLSLANGLLNMFSNLAVIAGSLAAGPLSDWFHPKAEGSTPLPWAPGLALTIVAVLGVAAVSIMPRLHVANPTLKFDLNPFGTYWASLREMAQSQLLTVTLAWSSFYMIGMIALLILPEYEHILDITYTQTSYFLGILGIGVAAGSVTVGLASGKRIRPVFISVGALGMTVCFLLLGWLNASYYSIAALIGLVGMFAGFYIVPLQALMQKLSPDDERGQFLGTANALSFCCSSIGAVIYWLATSRLGIPANRVHLICAAMGATALVVGIAQLRSLRLQAAAGTLERNPQ